MAPPIKRGSDNPGSFNAQRVRFNVDRDYVPPRPRSDPLQDQLFSPQYAMSPTHYNFNSYSHLYNPGAPRSDGVLRLDQAHSPTHHLANHYHPEYLKNESGKSQSQPQNQEIEKMNKLLEELLNKVSSKGSGNRRDDSRAESRDYYREKLMEKENEIKFALMKKQQEIELLKATGGKLGNDGQGPTQLMSMPELLAGYFQFVNPFRYELDYETL